MMDRCSFCGEEKQENVTHVRAGDNLAICRNCIVKSKKLLNATEFVNMIEAQNGYQANARTIRVATDILRELTSLIR